MHQTTNSVAGDRPQRRRSTAALAGLLGLAAFAVITPAMVSGSARTNVGSGAAEQKVARPFIAQLSGANEIGGGDADGTGAASITINPTTTEVCWDLRASNLNAPIAAHIHTGATGVNGPILVPLSAPNPTSTGCVLGSSLSPAVTTVMLEDIVAHPANYYVNVHDTTYPNGAIRGQLGVTTSFSGDVRILDEPLRAYDSRNDVAGPITVGTTRVVSLANGVDLAGAVKVAVPPGASAAIVKLSVTDTVNAGFLKMYSNALTTPPATATVNWDHTGTITGETGPVAVDAEAKVKVTAGVSNTHFVIDVVGYIF